MKIAYERPKGAVSKRQEIIRREGQPVWPERIDPENAQDIGGRQYRLVDDRWVEQTEQPDALANDPSSDAA